MPEISPNEDAVSDLWQRIDLDWITAAVVSREQETLHLDFKQATAELTKDDRKNLAKMVSGFANSDGGIIVWGVRAERLGDGPDCAVGLHPINPIEKFLSNLRRHAADAVNPAVAGVDHRIVRSEGAGGFGVSIVPRSDSGPYMAKLGEDRYYKRSGDQTLKMEHFEVADMFGRRRRPVLEIRGRLVQGSSMMSRGVASVTIYAEVSIWNIGRSAAVTPLVMLRATPLGTLNPHFAVENGLRRVELADQVGWLALGGGPATVIHPGTGLKVAACSRELTADSGVHDMVIDYQIAADGVPISSGNLRYTGLEIRAMSGLP